MSLLKSQEQYMKNRNSCKNILGLYHMMNQSPAGSYVLPKVLQLRKIADELLQKKIER
jgi:hypothetical protein